MHKDQKNAGIKLDFSTEMDFVELRKAEFAFSMWTAVPCFITLCILICDYKCIFAFTNHLPPLLWKQEWAMGHCSRTFWVHIIRYQKTVSEIKAPRPHTTSSSYPSREVKPWRVWSGQAMNCSLKYWYYHRLFRLSFSWFSQYILHMAIWISSTSRDFLSNPFRCDTQYSL
jgi:hypothetical protein